MSMSVPIAMVDASTSASTQAVPSGVNATVATIYRLMGRAVQPHHPVCNIVLIVAALVLHTLHKRLSNGACTIVCHCVLWCV